MRTSRVASWSASIAVRPATGIDCSRHGQSCKSRATPSCRRPALHYVDSEKARADLPAAKPRSIKGLGGCPFDSPDMQELGIASVTLNIVLNDIIYAEPAPGRSAYAYAGHTWYIADKNVANYDRYMRTAADHGWMVSAIILLQPSATPQRTPGFAMRPIPTPIRAAFTSCRISPPAPASKPMRP